MISHRSLRSELDTSRQELFALSQVERSNRERAEAAERRVREMEEEARFRADMDEAASIPTTIPTNESPKGGGNFPPDAAAAPPPAPPPAPEPAPGAVGGGDLSLSLGSVGDWLSFVRERSGR